MNREKLIEAAARAIRNDWLMAEEMAIQIADTAVTAILAELERQGLVIVSEGDCDTCEHEDLPLGAAPCCGCAFVEGLSGHARRLDAGGEK